MIEIKNMATGANEHPCAVAPLGYILVPDMYGGRTIQSARSKGIPDYTCNEGESL